MMGSITNKYTFLGFLFGLCFPLVGILVRIWSLEIPVSIESIRVVHQEDPLMWIIELAPFILAWFAWKVGRSQEKLANLNASLQKEVEDKTLDLKLQNDQLVDEISARKKTASELIKAKLVAESAAKAKSEFLSTMSHEIRTPMNAVIGMTGLLQGTVLNGEQKEFVDTIRISSNNLLSIINDILDYSKIEAGKMEVEEVELDLFEPIEDTLDLLSSKASEKKIELLVSFEKDLPRFIISDPAKITQILVNLVNNAIKFTTEGEIEVVVSHAGKVDAKEKIQISVRDTGIGIPPEKINKLFQSFSQADSSTTRKYGGTGLGLAICKRLAEILGGEVWVESEEGKGSIFSFTILAQKADRAWKLPEITKIKGKKVLLLDDNPTNLKILAYYCLEWGLEYDCFSNPREVLDQLASGNSWDFGILDMEMPEIDGIQVGMACRELFSKEEMPLILLSSIGLDLPKDSRNLFFSVLSKPARKTVILNRILELYCEDFTEVEEEEDQQKSPELVLKENRPEIRILLAEDNIINQKVATKILAKLGYQIDLATNGAEAVKALTDIPYDLVFMDVQMPVMDGLKATRAIRSELPHIKQPRIIAMTANAFKDDQAACMEAGMDDYLPKPIQIDQIAKMILKWFSTVKL